MRHTTFKYIPGDPWTICDRCGWKIRKSTVRKTWDGLMVCEKDWEPKHSQLYPTPVITGEGRQYPNARLEPTDTFVDVSDDLSPEDY